MDNSSIISADLVRYNANIRGKNVGDCVKRALSLATGMSYSDMSKELNEMAKKVLPRAYSRGEQDLYRRSSVYNNVIEDHGGIKHSYPEFDKIITLEEFVDNDLPSKGTFLVCTGKKPGALDHIVCIIDGKVYDSWDSRDQYVRCYYTFGDDFKVNRQSELNIAKLSYSEVQDLLESYNFTDRLTDKIATMLAKKKYGGVEFHIARLAVSNYKITAGVKLTFPPFDGQQKVRNYSFKIDIVATPFETAESFGKLIDTAINIRTYDRMYAIFQNEKKAEQDAREAEELASKFETRGDDRLKSRLDKMPMMYSNEAKFFKTLPGWAQKLATYFSINAPGQYSDSYEIYMVPLPDDPYHDSDDIIQIRAYDASEFRRKLQNYHDTYRETDDEW